MTFYLPESSIKHLILYKHNLLWTSLMFVTNKTSNITPSFDTFTSWQILMPGFWDKKWVSIYQNLWLNIRFSINITLYEHHWFLSQTKPTEPTTPQNVIDMRYQEIFFGMPNLSHACMDVSEVFVLIQTGNILPNKLEKIKFGGEKVFFFY